MSDTSRPIPSRDSFSSRTGSSARTGSARTGRRSAPAGLEKAAGEALPKEALPKEALPKAARTSAMLSDTAGRAKLLLVDFRSGEAVHQHPEVKPLLGEGWRVTGAAPRVTPEGTRLLVVLAPPGTLPHLPAHRVGTPDE